MYTYDQLPHLSQQRCKELIIDYVTYVPFRVIQIFQASLSLASILSLLYVIKKCIYGSTFHSNAKIIFIIYYLFATGHATINASMQMCQIIRSLHKDPCQAFSTRVEYETFNLCLATMTIGVVIMQFTILCERAVATLFVQHYEKHGVFFVVVFCIMAGFIIMGILLMTYRHEDFNELTFSMLNTPTSAAPRIRVMFIVLGCISVFVIIGMQALLIINKRTKTRFSRMQWSLSSRYQVMENMFITQFASCLSLLQLSIYVLFSFGGLSMRAARYLLFGNDEIAFGAARGVFYLIPLFTFLLPLLTLYLYQKYRAERQLSIETNLCMKTTGIDGAYNYQDVIAKAWRSPTKR